MIIINLLPSWELGEKNRRTRIHFSYKNTVKKKKKRAKNQRIPGVLPVEIVILFFFLPFLFSFVPLHYVFFPSFVWSPFVNRQDGRWEKLRRESDKIPMTIRGDSPNTGLSHAL
jgi:hypothetical protein